MKKILLFLLIPIFCFSQNDFSIYLDGNDYLREVVANYRSSDNVGTLMFWAKTVGTHANDGDIFSTADEGAATYYFYSRLKSNRIINRTKHNTVIIGCLCVITKCRRILT